MGDKNADKMRVEPKVSGKKSQDPQQNTTLRLRSLGAFEWLRANKADYKMASCQSYQTYCTGNLLEYILVCKGMN